eukprot:g26483.t1
MRFSCTCNPRLERDRKQKSCKHASAGLQKNAHRKTERAQKEHLDPALSRVLLDFQPLEDSTFRFSATFRLLATRRLYIGPGPNSSFWFIPNGKQFALACSKGLIYSTDFASKFDILTLSLSDRGFRKARGPLRAASAPKMGNGNGKDLPSGGRASNAYNPKAIMSDFDCTITKTHLFKGLRAWGEEYTSWTQKKFLDKDSKAIADNARREEPEPIEKWLNRLPTATGLCLDFMGGKERAMKVSQWICAFDGNFFISSKGEKREIYFFLKALENALDLKVLDKIKYIQGSDGVLDAQSGSEDTPFGNTRNKVKFAQQLKAQKYILGYIDDDQEYMEAMKKEQIKCFTGLEYESGGISEREMRETLQWFSESDPSVPSGLPPNNNLSLKQLTRRASNPSMTRDSNSSNNNNNKDTSAHSSQNGKDTSVSAGQKRKKKAGTPRNGSGGSDVAAAMVGVAPEADSELLGGEGADYDHHDNSTGHETAYGVDSERMNVSVSVASSMGDMKAQSHHRSLTPHQPITPLSQAMAMTTPTEQRTYPAGPRSRPSRPNVRKKQHNHHNSSNYNSPASHTDSFSREPPSFSPAGLIDTSGREDHDHSL